MRRAGIPTRCWRNTDWWRATSRQPRGKRWRASARPPMPDAGSLAEIFLQQSPACQWIVSTDGTFARMYGDPLPLFGRTAAELLGRIPGDVLGPDEAAAWRGRFARALNGEMMLLRERRAKGTWYVTVFPLRVEGETRFAGGSAREITPWSAAEQELRHTVLGALKAQEFERTMVSKF